MTDELRALWNLRELDEQLITLRAALARHPAERSALEKRLAEERVQLQGHQRDLHDHQLKHREIEKDVAALEAEERKFQSQLPMVKKNEEYQALLHEIADRKTRRSQRETDLLVLMEEEARLASRGPEIERALRAFEEESRGRLEAIAAEEHKVREEEAALEAQRQQHMGKLPTATRGRYERIRASREGRAVVPILPKGACGGCFRGQPPQMLQEARRQDRVLLCDGCGRILILPPEGS